MIAVTGGRDYANRHHVFAALDSIHSRREITKLLEGGATGADRLCREWAIENGVPYRTYYARWDIYGKRAGPLRNRQMLDERPDFLIAFPGGYGTKNCIGQARFLGIHVVAPPAEKFRKEY